MPHSVPQSRVRSLNGHPARPEGDYVLYWMVASRRTRFSHGLDRAVQLCREFGRPLLVVEALRADYRWAGDRHHAFVLQGMADNQADCARHGVRYFPYAEPEPGQGSGLIEALAERAVAVVTDDWPCFFVPRMQAAAAARLAVRLEAVDSNGLLPIRATERSFSRAYDFRRFLARELPSRAEPLPASEPLADLAGFATAELPAAIRSRWPEAGAALLAAEPTALARLPIDHGIAAVAGVRGGALAGAELLQRFLRSSLEDYGERRSHPDDDLASGLSPYIHYGQVGIHQIVAAVAELTGDDPRSLAAGEWIHFPDHPAHAFLDQCVTWRELGFNACVTRPDDYDGLGSLPAWARLTIAQHAGDRRPHLYSFDELDQSRTHDPLWNAAQTQLREEGRMQNYLRMLWGKKIYEWTPSAEVALRVMVELNNRYALDGRDPNSYSGILWVLGRFDRAWGPERPVFGKLRYMTSDSARRKLRLKAWLERYDRPELRPVPSAPDRP